MAYASMDFQLFAVIDGVTVDLVQFACSYELNKIPTATALLPVGKSVTPPHSVLRTAHTLSNSEMLQVPIQVYVTVNFYSGDMTAIIPAGTYCIFCGWVTGVGYRRTYAGYVAAIECTHWLSALTFSSALLEGWHPNNPAHYNFPALMVMPGGAGGGLDEQTEHTSVATVAQHFITAAGVQADLWGQAILPWFLEMATNHKRLGGAAMGANDNDSVGGEAAAALNAFDGDLLPVKLHGAAGADVAMAICNDIGPRFMLATAHSHSPSAMANVTLWDKLAGELASQYMFRIVPYPTKAKVVPYIPSLRDAWDPYGCGFTILARDMELQDMGASLPRATRGVGILAGIGGAGGADLPGKQGGAWNMTIGGVYKGRDDGVVIIRDAPGWMANIKVKYVYTVESLGIGAVRSTAHSHPGVGAAPTKKSPRDLHDEQAAILNQLAHAFYVEEQLKNRFGSITTPVRFDIAPGSTISFEGTDPAGMAGEARFGSVISTSHMFDAQHQRCYTSFQLSHVRTSAEHFSDDYTLTSHPLYDRTWTGDYNLYAGACP